MSRSVGRVLVDNGATPATLNTQEFMTGLKSGTDDFPLASACSVERLHAHLRSISELAKGKKRNPKRTMIPHLLARFRHLHARSVRPSVAGHLRRVRKNTFRKKVNKAKKALSPTKHRLRTSGGGGLRLQTWWVNRETQRLSRGHRRSRGNWQKLREGLVRSFQLLSKEAHDQAEKDYERWRLVREAEKPAPADPSPVAWSPFGVGSRTSPVAPAKLNAHIDEVMRGQTSRGVQAVAQHLEWTRRNDASSVVSTLVGPADAAVAAKILDYKMILRHRDKNKRCVELHPGVCKKADAEFLRFALVVHKQTLGPRLTLASDHHKGDGSTLLIAGATEADDPPIGLEVGCIGQPFVFYAIEDEPHTPARGSCSHDQQHHR